MSLIKGQLIARCSVKAPLIAELAKRVGWSRMWDATLDLGGKSIKGLQYPSRVMSRHGRGDHPCPLCDVVPLLISLLQHLLEYHNTDLYLGHHGLS